MAALVTVAPSAASATELHPVEDGERPCISYYYCERDFFYVVEGDPGERSDLRIDRVGEDRHFRFRDPANAVRFSDSYSTGPSRYCESRGEHEVECTGTSPELDRRDASLPRVSLADGDDRALVSTPARIDGGAGRDTLEGPGVMFGGDGADRLIAATSRTETLNGGSGSDTCGVRRVAGPTTSALSGGSGPDVVAGGPGNDQLSGGPGEDVLNGGGGNDDLADSTQPPDSLHPGGPSGDGDVLRGASGDDGVLDLGGRGDRLFGGPGTDVLCSRDGEPDAIECGDGRDTVLAGAADSVAADCEDVTRRGGTGRPPRPAPEDVVARPVRVRQGRLRIPVACRGPARSVCRGTVRASLACGARRSLVTSRLWIATGDPRVLRPRLSARVRRRLVRTRCRTVVLRFRVAQLPTVEDRVALRR